MLDGLDDIAWNELTHAYGDAGDIPNKIRSLQSSNPQVWVLAISNLYDTLCHQTCSVYSATEPAIPFLIELLGDRDVRCRGRILELLADMAFVVTYTPDGEDFEDDPDQDELEVRILQSIWQGIDCYRDLIVDLNPRVRVIAPYLLGALAQGAEPTAGMFANLAARMRSQFEEEPVDLVCASLVFGLAHFIGHDSNLASWLEQQVTSSLISPTVKMAAALCLAERQTQVRAAVTELLIDGLQYPDVTNQLFRSDQPAMENRHHPIGRAMLEYEGKLDEQDDDGSDEDLNLPWPGRWGSGLITFRILELLSRLQFDDVQPLLPVLLPWVDRANEYTADSIIIPIVKLVLGEPRLTPDSKLSNVSPAGRAILLRLFNHLPLWTTKIGQNWCYVIGLEDLRRGWARFLEQDPELTDAQIEQVLRQKLDECDNPSLDNLREITLTSVGSTKFLIRLQPCVNLRSLHLAYSPLTDDDVRLIAQFHQLEELNLSGTEVTDGGAAQLRPLKNLKSLFLYGTQVTDNCLQTLEQFPNLEFVSVQNSAVTEEGVQAFKERRPECRVMW